MARARRYTKDGHELPSGVEELLGPDGRPSAYKVRWWETDPDTGARRQRSQNCATLDEAADFKVDVRRLQREGATVAKPSPAGRMTLDELFDEWLEEYAAPRLSSGYVLESARYWETEIKPRIGSVRFSHLADNPGILVDFQREVERSGKGAATLTKILNLVKGVIKRAMRWHPGVLTYNPARDHFEMPVAPTTVVVRPLPLIAIERIREAVLSRPARNEIRPLRDALFVALMAEAVAPRPSELLRATFDDVNGSAIVLQGKLKRGQTRRAVRLAWLPTLLRDDLVAYREELEKRFGPQPGNALVFQKLAEPTCEPIWRRDDEPQAWTKDDYKRWADRVWRPACRQVAQAERSLAWLAHPPRFYDLRHTSVTVALRSKRWPDQEVAEMAGHSRKVQSDTYSGIVREYRGDPPRDPEELVAEARAEVAAHPRANQGAWRGAQRDRQRRHRARARTFAEGDDGFPR